MTIEHDRVEAYFDNAVVVNILYIIGTKECSYFHMQRVCGFSKQDIILKFFVEHIQGYKSMYAGTLCGFTFKMQIMTM